MKGKLIVVEGIDGSGKTTLARELASYLGKQLPYEVCHTEILGDGATLDRALRLNQELLIADDDRFEPGLRTLRRDITYYEVIKPALQAGAWVVCDRYDFSELIYHEVEADFQRLPLPDLSLFLSVKPQAARARCALRAKIFTGSSNLFGEDASPISEYARRARSYRMFFESLPGGVLINSQQKPSEVFEEARKAIVKAFGLDVLKIV